MLDRELLIQRLHWCFENNWIAECELERLTGVLDPSHVFAESLQLAETIHAHIKVPNADQIDEDALRSEGAWIHYRKTGFVKYCFDSGINLIFSSIPISQDDLRNGTAAPAKKFLDHIGIDLRQITAETKSVFDAIPTEASRRGWGIASQGTEGRPVYCCHIEVGQKHWIYPEDRYTKQGARSMPLEFALGELKINELSAGCDLRPSDPRYHDATPCCGSQS